MVAATVVYYAEKWLPGLLREPTMSTTSKGKLAEKKEVLQHSQQRANCS
jgi:hypothetical protein